MKKYKRVRVTGRERETEREREGEGEGERWGNRKRVRESRGRKNT